MGKFQQVVVLEVEMAKDKSKETEGGKYRRDTPWLVEAFRKQGVKSEIVFMTRADTADVLANKYPNTAFFGRVNPMDYDCMSLDEYIVILNGLEKKKLLLGPNPDHMDRLGSKMSLYDLRDSTMGIKGIFLHKLADMQKNDTAIDAIIPKGGPPRVLKMMRGSTGLGVWKLVNKGDNILMTDAYSQTTKDIGRKEVLVEFCKLSNEDAISMPFLPLISAGEFRFLLTKHKILEIVHKRPVDENAFTATLRSGAVYTILDLVEHKAMVDAVEKWTHQLMKLMKMDDVPIWWSVDCIEEDGCTGDQIPSSNKGRRLVLSEMNCSCLGMVADTSEEAKAKGMRFAEHLAQTALS